MIGLGYLVNRLRQVAARPALLAAGSIVALGLATAPAAQADVIRYTVLDLSAFGSGFGADSIMGSFDYDTSTEQLSSVSIVVQGGWEPGPYDDNPSYDTGFGYVGVTDSGTNLVLFLNEPLGSLAINITAVNLNGVVANAGSGTFTGVDISGDSSAPVPEPASIALLGAAVAFLGFSRVGARNKSGRAVEF
jgi:hypothetical protein